MSALERTQVEMVRDVFGPIGGDDREALVRRVQALTVLALDLLAEVEALRQIHIAEPAYRDAYRQTGLLTHDAAGPTSGWQKLLGRFYPRQRAADGRVWRESLMLDRLGAEAADIDVFRREAEEMEQYT